MSAEQPSKEIHILQNITLKSLSDQTKNMSRRQKMTSSMYFFEEEPVSSDSEDELESEEEIMIEEPPDPIKRFCDVGIQCEILKEEKNIIGLINQCANLPTETGGVYGELISICKKLDASHHDVLNSFDGCSDISGNSSKEQTKLSPTGLLVLRSGGIDEETISKQRKKKSVKYSYGIRRSSRERRPPKRANSGIFLNSKMLKELKKLKKQEKENKDLLQRSVHSLNTTFNNGGMENNNSSNRRKSHIQISSSEEKLIENIGDSESGVERRCEKKEALFQLFSSPKAVKSFARNWMKPNKSLSVLNESCSYGPSYLSLQHNKKIRRLYSPTKFLESIESTYL